MRQLGARCEGIPAASASHRAGTGARVCQEWRGGPWRRRDWRAPQTWVFFFLGGGGSERTLDQVGHSSPSAFATAATAASSSEDVEPSTPPMSSTVGLLEGAGCALSEPGAPSAVGKGTATFKDGASPTVALSIFDATVPSSSDAAAGAAPRSDDDFFGEWPLASWSWCICTRHGAREWHHVRAVRCYSAQISGVAERICRRGVGENSPKTGKAMCACACIQSHSAVHGHIEHMRQRKHGAVAHLRSPAEASRHASMRTWYHSR